jgi:hypothetical protein
VLTVLPWSSVRRSRKPLSQVALSALTDEPTLLAILSDRYTNEHHLRPFAPLAERFGDRLHVLVVAGVEQADREVQGEPLLRELGIAPEARRRMLRDEGPARVAALLSQRQQVALLDLFCVERAYTTLDGRPEPRARELQAREDAVARAVEELLGRLPPPRRKLDANAPWDRFELIEMD